MDTTEGNASNEPNTTFGNVEYTKTVSRKDSLEIHAYWIIPKFLKLNDNEAINDIDSPTSVLSGCNLKLQLGIVSVKRNKNIGIHYRIFLPTKNPTIFIKSVVLKMFTFDKKNWVYDKELSIVARDEHVIVEANAWSFITRLSAGNLHFVKGNKICYLKDGSLHLKYELVISTEEESNEDTFEIPRTNLRNDMAIIFHQSMYTDVVIKSADDKEFRVLKAVLSNRCAVLKALFEHNTTDSITNVVESPIISEVLHEVLLFIYTDEAPKADEMPEKLLAAADYYQLSRLKSLCERALYEKLSAENAIEIWQLADLHLANTLKQQTLKFIRRSDEQLNLIMKSQAWAKLQPNDKLKIINDDAV